MQTITTETIIIGAGPAGLTTAAALKAHQADFIVLEEGTDGVATSWRKHYERLHLHTVKELSHLRNAPFPDSFPRYVPRLDLLRYYEDFAKANDLPVHLGRCVEQIIPSEAGGWQVECANGEVYRAANVVICTGLNRIPYSPEWPGQASFNGQLLHSSAYFNAAPFEGKRVLVVGMGNSGAEIALDLCESGVEAALSVRNPVNIVPRELFGKPTQITALQLAKLPHWLADFISWTVRRFTLGDLPRYGLRLSPMPPTKQLRVTGQTPVIDLGTIDLIRKGRLKVWPGIEKFTSDGVVFSNGYHLAADAVICATGFRTGLEQWFGSAFKEHFDDRGLPRHPVGVGTMKGLFFLGFNNYVPGGALTVIRQDVEAIIQALSPLGK